MRSLSVQTLGTISYEDGLALQAKLVEERRAGSIPDTLLLLEHPPVITLGVKTRRGPNHIVATDDALARAAALVRDAQRPLLVAGGGVIYSGATDALRGFAEAMGGALVADASPGGGLTMRLRVPVAQASDARVVT